MPLPRVQPIPTRRKDPFDHTDWLFDVKYNGFRALAYIEGGRCRLISRNGKPLGRFAPLGAEVAAALAVDEAVIDGEVIVTDRDRPSAILRTLTPHDRARLPPNPGNQPYDKAKRHHDKAQVRG